MSARFATLCVLAFWLAVVAMLVVLIVAAST